MAILKLTSGSQRRFLALPETGMGFHFVTARTRRSSETAGFIVLGSSFGIPIEPYPGLTDIKSLEGIHSLDEVEDESLTEDTLEIDAGSWASPVEARAVLFMALSVLTHPNYQAGSDEAELMPPAPGTPLTVRTACRDTDAFLRFSYTSKDPRIGSNGDIAAGTYATTFRDGMIVTSGLSAVARYALPVPLPAEYLFLLTPPDTTRVHLGAAGPLFGQSGGGVEAYFPDAFKNTPRCFAIPPY